MKILMLVPFPGIQGPLNKHTGHLIAALQSLGCEVVTEPWGRHHDHESWWDKGAGRAQDVARIRRRLRMERCELLLIKTAHTWAGLLRDIPLMLATRRYVAHTVIQFHGSASNWLVAPGRRLFKLFSSVEARLSDALLVLSTEELREWHRFAPTCRCWVVSNPFVPTTATLSAAPEDWRLPASSPVVLYVGRLIEPKGILDLIQAMPRVLRRTPCHLLVAGTGPEEAQVRRAIKAAGLDEHVTLAGYVTGGQLAAAYRAASAFVLPTYWPEGFPFVINEAMDAGLPIITTQIRGAADRLVEGTHALFVPPRNPGALADALIRLLIDPTLRDGMSRANRRLSLQFAPDVVGRHYVDALETVANNR